MVKKPANYYDRYHHYLKLNLREVESARTIKKWLRGKKKIIDIGCGAGHQTAFLGATGIDHDPQALKIAKKHFPKTKFILGDITQKLPFKKNSVDALVCSNVLEHLTNKGREKFFAEAKKILKKDGVFILSYVDLSHWMNHLLASLIPDYGIKDPTHLVSWSIPEFKKYISRHFQIIKEKKVSPYGRLIFVTQFIKGEFVACCQKK